MGHVEPHLLSASNTNGLCPLLALARVLCTYVCACVRVFFLQHGQHHGRHRVLLSTDATDEEGPKNVYKGESFAQARRRRKRSRAGTAVIVVVVVVVVVGIVRRLASTAKSAEMPPRAACLEGSVSECGVHRLLEPVSDPARTP